MSQAHTHGSVQYSFSFHRATTREEDLTTREDLTTSLVQTNILKSITSVGLTNSIDWRKQPLNLSRFVFSGEQITQPAVHLR